VSHCNDAQRSVEDSRTHCFVFLLPASWSAAWEASLWARLGSPDEFWRSVSRVLADYSAPNLLGLHPALEPSLLGEQSCDTCFSEANGFREDAASSLLPQSQSVRVPEERRQAARRFSEEQLAHKRGMGDEYGGVVSQSSAGLVVKSTCPISSGTNNNDDDCGVNDVCSSS
jgi:hypothetical protein